MSVVHALPSAQLVGQLDTGSQVSPGSTTELPHVAEQSSSVVASQPAGQHPSAFAQDTIAVCEQAALQLLALPVSTSVVQALPSSHAVAQVDAGSHVSPGSTTPLPQVGEHSASVNALHPLGQHPSPFAQEMIEVCEHAALQFAALPVRTSVVQALPSWQELGQLDGGSQVSPGSTTVFPQLWEQSRSVADEHPLGQQPSPLAQEVMAA